MTLKLLACLQPRLSVYSLSVPSPEATADPVVRRALTEAYPLEVPQAVAVAVREAAVIRITALAEQAGGRFRRVTVVRVEPNEDFVYRILAWE